MGIVMFVVRGLKLHLESIYSRDHFRNVWMVIGVGLNRISYNICCVTFDEDHLTISDHSAQIPLLLFRRQLRVMFTRFRCRTAE